jgi:DNA-directed RNA polymerase I, II, and III subunit RPABC1
MEISITEIYSARNHLLDILKEQGYDVSDYNNCGINNVGAMMDTNQLDLLLTHSSGKRIFVKYSLTKRLNLFDLVASLFDGEEKVLKKTDDLMVIVKSEPNDTLISSIDTVWNEQGIYVSVINIYRLQFNILKHTQVPKHEILTEEEKAQLFLTHHISSVEDLPFISRYDPVALVMCMRPGMVCRIHRKSKTSVISMYYRACV